MEEKAIWEGAGLRNGVLLHQVEEEREGWKIFQSSSDNEPLSSGVVLAFQKRGGGRNGPLWGLGRKARKDLKRKAAVEGRPHVSRSASRQMSSAFDVGV